MEKIRIGNDIVVLWAIRAEQDGEKVPYDLTGRKLSLYVSNQIESWKVQDFETNGSALRWMFCGKDQKHVGTYTLTLVENEGEEEMHTVDMCNAFRLVPRTCQNEEEENDVIELVTLEFLSDFFVQEPLEKIDVDTELSIESENPVENRVITEKFDEIEKSLEKKADSSTLAKVAKSGSYNDLSNKPTIPTKVSQLTNDKNYASQSQVDDLVEVLVRKADLDDAGKIIAEQLPDYILGQLMFGGVIFLSGEVQATISFKEKYNLPGRDVTIVQGDYEKYEGVFFIASATGNIFGKDVNTGDWLLSTGENWEKIDNSDAVASVAGLTGTITATALAKALAETSDANELALKSELNNKQDKLVSGTNIKTINGQSILGSGNIEIKSSGEANVQSDWAQEDVADDSYIKNRTHYCYDSTYVGQFVTESKEVGDVLFEGLSEGVQYTIFNNRNTSKRYSFQFVTGRKINIPFNGPTVEAVCSEDGSLVLASSAYGIAEHFYVYFAEVKQLDDIYIPETIARTSELKTINGESIVGSGDLTIEGGAKIYTWSPTITSIEEDTQISGTFTEEEYYNILNADVLYINVDGAPIFCIARGINSENGEGILITGSQITTYADFAIDISVIKEDGVFMGTMSEPIPSKTSQLENDSNFISSDGLKTINGQSLLGEGDITIGGGSADNVFITDFTINDLQRLIADPDLSIQADIPRLRDALAEHKVVLVPYDSDDMLRGYGIAVGYAEDLLYVTIMLDDGSIYIETDINEEIRSGEVSRRQYHESVEQHTYGDLDRVAMANGIRTTIGGMIYAFPDTIIGEEDDILLSRGTVKTINGHGLFVDENSNDIITTYERITTSSSSVELLPNTVIEWPVPIRFQELVLTFGEQPPQGYAVEYIAKFTVGIDGVQLIVPDGIRWADGVYPAMTDGKTYEISFMDEYATFLEF